MAQTITDGVLNEELCDFLYLILNKEGQLRFIPYTKSLLLIVRVKK